MSFCRRMRHFSDSVQLDVNIHRRVVWTCRLLQSPWPFLAQDRGHLWSDIEPMASVSFAVSRIGGHTCCPARVWPVAFGAHLVTTSSAGCAGFWSNGEDVHFHPEVQIVERIQDLIFVVQGFVETLVVDVSVPQAAEVPAPQFPKPVVGVKAPTQRVP